MSLDNVSFTVSYELNGQTYTTSGYNISVLETTSNGITNYTISLGFSDKNFYLINENTNNTTIQLLGIYISIYLLLSNNIYIITGPTTTPRSEFGPSITFNTTNSSLVPNDFYENITVSISYVYNNTYYNFKTTGEQKTNPQTVTPSNYYINYGIYSYTYTLALLFTSNSKSNTATFSSNALQGGNTAATVTKSALRLFDPLKTNITDEEAADIAISVSTSVSHLVSSVETSGDAISKIMKALNK